MHIPTLIARKRDGGALSAREIQLVIERFTSGEMPDYQMSALAMAIFFRGMNDDEMAALVDAMLHSGSVLSWAADAPLRVDKHSTGGIGDKTSLIIAPLLACDGLWVPMISGRGLGITGGTLDKLESIPGFNTQLKEERIREILSEIGCVMIGQTADICPADKKLYALRDVTGTVPSIPLITASIMSKKLAEGLNRLVLDVKYGSGAFMQSRADAEILAGAMRRAGSALGVETTALLHLMDEPTGHSAGNALEVAEASECLQGRGPADLEKICLDLAAAVSNSPREALAERLRDGSAWDRFQKMAEAQGGDVTSLERITEIHAAPVIHEVCAKSSGILTRIDARQLGLAVLGLGAGRATADDAVDFAVGCDQIAKTGTAVSEGDVIARIHARSKNAAVEAEKTILAGVEIR